MVTPRCAFAMHNWRGTEGPAPSWWISCVEGFEGLEAEDAQEGPHRS